MTDTGAALWLLVLCLLLGAVVNVSIFISMIPVWWQSIRVGTNGPRVIIMRGTMRRVMIRVIVQTALLVSFGTRVLTGHPTRPLVTALIVLVVVIALTADAVGDMFDYRLLRWTLRIESKP